MEETFAYIERLPLDCIDVILSKVDNIKELVRTSAISKQFQKAWLRVSLSSFPQDSCSTTTISYDPIRQSKEYKEFSRRAYYDKVNGVLRCVSSKSDNSNTLCTYIAFAVMHHPIDFSMKVNGRHVLDLEMPFRYLQNLKLENINIPEHMDLNIVEKLSLYKCCMCGSVQPGHDGNDVHIRGARLQVLEIINGYLCSYANLVLEAPRLNTLVVQGQCFHNFRLTGDRSCQIATLNLRESNYITIESLFALLNEIAEIRSLVFSCSSLLKKLKLPEKYILSTQINFPNLETLEVTGNCSSIELQLIKAILMGTTNLRFFHLKTKKVILNSLLPGFSQELAALTQNTTITLMDEDGQPMPT